MLERARVYIVRTQFLIFRKFKFRGNGRFTHTDTHHVTRCVLIICRRAQARTGGGAQGDRIEPKLLFFAMGLNKSYDVRMCAFPTLYNIPFYPWQMFWVPGSCTE